MIVTARLPLARADIALLQLMVYVFYEKAPMGLSMEEARFYII
jgi:hypothetical protein